VVLGLGLQVGEVSGIHAHEQASFEGAAPMRLEQAELRTPATENMRSQLVEDAGTTSRARAGPLSV
jgi:hypothetical protein